jgi:hypothetical protein
MTGIAPFSITGSHNIRDFHPTVTANASTFSGLQSAGGMFEAERNMLFPTIPRRTIWTSSRGSFEAFSFYELCKGAGTQYRKVSMRAATRENIGLYRELGGYPIPIRPHAMGSF